MTTHGHTSASIAASRTEGRAAPNVRPQVLSEAECHDLLQRLARFATGGGSTGVTIRSRWAGNVRWARNQISTAGDVRTNWISVERTINGARGHVVMNDTTDAALVAAARRAERLSALAQESRDLDTRVPLEPATTPQLFSEATYQLDANRRAAAAHQLAQAAAMAGVLSAGYIEVSATSIAALDTLGRVRYFQYTDARYSVTVRDSKGIGSGWAGDSAYDWSLIDGPTLSTLALEKCLTSRHPVAIEPGRYTTILEPQAVCDFVGQLVYPYGALGRVYNEEGNTNLGPFYKSSSDFNGHPGFSVLGERVADVRVTISADPMDPELGFPPFNTMYQGAAQFFDDGEIYHAATWIDRGVLTNLAYNRDYGITELGHTTGLPNSGAFRMQGGTTSVEEMIATTKRGLLVTRFDSVLILDNRSQLCRGYTRDGLWLIESGKISKPVKNMVFTESILFALNNIEQLGPPRRTFHPNPPSDPFLYICQPQPVVVPPLKVKDFNFTSQVDAV